MNLKLELQRLNDNIATAKEAIAESRLGVANVLAACEGGENEDPREPNAEEQQQLDGAQAAISAKEKAIEGWTVQRDNIAAALEAESHAQVIRSSRAGVEVDGSLRGTGTVAEGRDDRGFSGIGEYGSAVARAMTPSGAVDERLAPLAAITGMGQTIGSDGGFLVPPAFSTMIWDGMMQNESNLLPLTDQYAVTGESLTFNASAETSRATGSRAGGVRAYWITEGDQLTGSKTKFRQIKLEPKQLAVLVYATDKLLNNAPALETYLARAAQNEIAFLVSDAIINGDGAGKPRGILAGAVNNPRVRVSKETGQAASTIVTENIVKMYAQLVPSAISGARWLINQDILPQLLLMSLSVGTGGVPVYLPPNGLSSAPYGTLLGRPVQPVEYCQTLGTEGDIILTDLGFYCSGTQGGVESAMSMHLRFDYLESVFRFVFAVDGQPWVASALTPFKGSNQVSPIVTLQTRS